MGLNCRLSFSSMIHGVLFIRSKDPTDTYPGGREEAERRREAGEEGTGGGMGQEREGGGAGDGRRPTSVLKVRDDAGAGCLGREGRGREERGKREGRGREERGKREGREREERGKGKERQGCQYN